MVGELHWQATRDHATVARGGEPVSVAGFLAGLAQDARFRASFTDVLRGVPHRAFCWETPSMTLATLDRPFECAFVESPALDRAVADAGPFGGHFTEGDVVSFESLGRDALLVAPCPRGPIDAYAHLGVFVREAPAAQVDALWKHVAAAVLARIDERPLWLSTAGLGVSWLHVRLDSRPKYYRTEAYRR